MPFLDRNEAAVQLAERLSNYHGNNPLILAIPRGAVPMGKVIAEALEGELDVVLAAKIPAPGNPEFAIGTVSENGWMQIAEWAHATGASPEYLEQQREILLEKLRNRRQEYSTLKNPVDPKDRIVIVVDDGLATGLTMIGALEALRRLEPRKLVVAIPVASSSALLEVGRYADEIVCLSNPRSFRSVSEHYNDFNQISDAEVATILSKCALNSLKAREEPDPAARQL